MLCQLASGVGYHRPVAPRRERQMEIAADAHVWTWLASNWPLLPVLAGFWWFSVRPLHRELRSIDAHLARMSQAHTVHEKVCEERWKDAFRRMAALEEMRGETHA